MLIFWYRRYWNQFRRNNREIRMRKKREVFLFEYASSPLNKKQLTKFDVTLSFIWRLLIPKSTGSSQAWLGLIAFQNLWVPVRSRCDNLEPQNFFLAVLIRDRGDSQLRMSVFELSNIWEQANSTMSRFLPWLSVQLITTWCLSHLNLLLGKKKYLGGCKDWQHLILGCLREF